MANPTDNAATRSRVFFGDLATGTLEIFYPDSTVQGEVRGQEPDTVAREAATRLSDIEGDARGVPPAAVRFHAGLRGRSLEEVVRSFLPDHVAVRDRERLISQIVGQVSQVQIDTPKEVLALQVVLMAVLTPCWEDPRFVSQLDPWVQASFDVPKGRPLEEWRMTLLAALTGFLIEFPPTEIKRLLSRPENCAVALSYSLVASVAVEQSTRDRYTTDYKSLLQRMEKEGGYDRESTRSLTRDLSPFPWSAIQDSTADFYYGFIQRLHTRGILIAKPGETYSALQIGAGIEFKRVLSHNIEEAQARGRGEVHHGLHQSRDHVVGAEALAAGALNVVTSEVATDFVAEVL